MSPQCVETSFYLISCVISTQRQHGQHTQLGVACKVQCVLFWWLVVLTQGAYQLMAEDSTPVCRMWWAIIAHRALILKQHVPCQGHRKDFWSGECAIFKYSYPWWNSLNHRKSGPAKTGPAGPAPTPMHVLYIQVKQHMGRCKYGSLQETWFYFLWNMTFLWLLIYFWWNGIYNFLTV